MDEIFGRASVTPNMTLAQPKASWRIQRRFRLDGIVRGRPPTSNRTLVLLKMRCRRKKQFRVDGVVGGRTAMSKIIKAL